MRFVNDPGPWLHGVDRDLSMVDLLATGTVPPEPAAALWWAVENGASLLTAGGPSGAGKTILANAALAFLPEAARVYVVSGRGDPLALPAGDGPAYLLLSELSEHGKPEYVSGPTARRAFAALRDGVRLVGTLHADSVAEAVDALLHDFALPAADVARVTLIAVTRITRGEFRRRPSSQPSPDIERRVVEIGLLATAAGGVRAQALAAWDAGRGRLGLTPGAGAALAGWAGAPAAAVEAAVRQRADALGALRKQGRRAPSEVAAAVRGLRAGT
jgi:hypothetical protein